MPKSNPAHPSALVTTPKAGLKKILHTDLGQLYQGDCLALLKAMPDGCVDTVFADPPFNLKKDYGPGVTDEMKEHDYLAWTREWVTECVRVCKPGGAVLIFNLPRWLISTGCVLEAEGMMFRHWIAFRMPKTYPRPGRMAPAHYGCLYYTKGKPATFNKVYVPVPTCRHCHHELRDYGGHRKALNDKGLNLMDYFELEDEVWTDAPVPLPRHGGWTQMEDTMEDIPPVRHSKFKTRGANELAPILLERLITMTTNKGDVVFDPFGGAGTTYIASERLGRRWLGVELGSIEPIRERMDALAKGEMTPWETARGELLVRQQQQVAAVSEARADAKAARASTKKKTEQGPGFL
jgi:site-specific DNA-methyltransferase (adenine-specific)